MNYFLLFMIFFTFRLKADIIIRPAAAHELDAILELDRRVTDEFFYPLFVSLFSKLHINNDPEQELEKDILKDELAFSEGIKAEGNDRLHVAWDDNKDALCGMIAFHKEKNNCFFLIPFTIISPASCVVISQKAWGSDPRGEYSTAI